MGRKSRKKDYCADKGHKWDMSGKCNREKPEICLERDGGMIEQVVSETVQSQVFVSMFNNFVLQCYIVKVPLCFIKLF